MEAAPADLEKLEEVGLDTEHAVQSEGAQGKIRLDAVITEDQADLLRAEGLSVQVKKVNGRTASEAARLQNLAGYDAYRSYSEPGGIADELRETAAAYPKITKLVTIGKTVQGKDILALKVTKDAKKVKDGKRPSVLYGGAQHAREWITPEMVRRLMHYYLEGYGSDPQLTRIIRTTELWFLPVSNPDGYDYTFSADNRLWRKNLRDNDGDGQTHRERRRRPQPQLRGQVGLGQRGLLDRPGQRDLPRHRPELRAGDPGPRPAVRPGRVRVLRQLPLRGRAAALRHRLAGEHALARRRDLRGHGRRRREPGDPRLRPGHLRRALHHQRRHRHARHGRVRHPGLHPRDDHLRDGLGLGPRRRVGSRRLHQRLQLPR